MARRKKGGERERGGGRGGREGGGEGGGERERDSERERERVREREMEMERVGYTNQGEEAGLTRRDEIGSFCFLCG